MDYFCRWNPTSINMDFCVAARFIREYSSWSALYVSIPLTNGQFLLSASSWILKIISVPAGCWSMLGYYRCARCCWYWSIHRSLFRAIAWVLGVRQSAINVSDENDVLFWCMPSSSLLDLSSKEPIVKWLVDDKCHPRFRERHRKTRSEIHDGQSVVIFPHSAK